MSGRTFPGVGVCSSNRSWWAGLVAGYLGLLLTAWAPSASAAEAAQPSATTAASNVTSPSADAPGASPAASSLAASSLAASNAPAPSLAASSPAPPVQGGSSAASPVDAPVFPEGAQLDDVPADYGHYDGGWIHFYYAPSVWPRVQTLIAAAGKARAELRRELGEDVLDVVHVRVARTVGEMESLAPKGVPYPSYASGVAYSRIGLVLLSVYPKNQNSVHDLEGILRHELVHVALYDALRGHPIPRWFNEGLAVHLSGERSYQRVQTLWVSTLAGNLLPLAALDRDFPTDLVETPLAYAQSADVVRYLLRGQGTERFPMLIRRIASGQSFESALDDAYGVDLVSLEYDWRQEVAKRYSFWPLLLGGSLIWVVAIGLFLVGWYKKRKAQTVTLERWAREEAIEDARTVRLATGDGIPRVHIVLSGSRDAEVMGTFPPPPPSGRPKTELDVPKVEHDGNWHTLH